jgi:hypothetical protein
MVIEGPATGQDAMSMKDIMQQCACEIDTIIKNATDPAYDFERQVLILQARLNWEFVRNQHFNVPGTEITPFGGYSDISYFDPGLHNSEETGPDVRLAPPINVMGADLYKFIGVMAANAPRVKGVADDIHDPDSMHAAFCADVNIRDIWWKQKIDRKWKALAFHQYVTGPAYVRCVWNTDRIKYGESVEPKIEIQQGPDGMPYPSVTGDTPYANGDSEAHIYSVLEVSHEWELKELCDAKWFNCEVFRNKWELLAKYQGDDGSPGPLDKYRDMDPPDDDATASTYAAEEARGAVSNPSGTGRIKRPNYWRHCERWIRPCVFESIPDQAKRQIFKEHFPDGIYIAKVGSVTCEVDNRKVTDEWEVCRIGRGDKILDRPIGSDVLPINRAIDDLFGMSLETVLRAITQTIMSAGLIDREAMNTKQAIPAEVILTQIPPEKDLRELIFQIPPAHLSDQVRPLIEFARALMQDISGIRPEIAGGGAPTQTYREAKQRKDQALAQLAPQAQAMLDCAQGVAEKLVRLRAKYGAGTVKAQRKSAYGTKTDIADIASLKDTGWHAEADDQFPMTVSDRRDAVYSMLKDFPPEVQQALSVLDPLNISELYELLQIPGFESAVEEQKEKTLADIELLLNEQPIDGPPNPDGTPGPKQPSVPPDVYDNHPLVANIIQKWCVGNRDVQHSNPAGFANVVARFTAEQQLATPSPPPAPPPLKGSVSWTGKLEDFPNLVSEILAGEGLNVPPPAQPQPASPAPAPPPGLAPPAPVGPPTQEAPIPPMPTGPNGPAPPPVQ